MQLDQLQGLMPDLQALGYQILAVSGDAPARTAKLVAKRKLTYSVLSDENLRVVRQFGIAYMEGQWLLPAPATFIIGTDGLIRFRHVSDDYQVRLESESLLAAAKAGLK